MSPISFRRIAEQNAEREIRYKLSQNVKYKASNRVHNTIIRKPEHDPVYRIMFRFPYYGVTVQ